MHVYIRIKTCIHVYIIHAYIIHHTYIHRTYIHHTYIHTYIHACIHVSIHTCRLSKGLLFSTFWGLGFMCSVSFTRTHTRTHTHRVFQGQPRRPLNPKPYCMRERSRERVVRTQHRGQHGRWTAHAGVRACIGGRETGLSDSREWGVSARLEGQDSTCREASANLLSSTMVVSDCASVYLSARADVALPP
jgi:hypothetical protein